MFEKREKSSSTLENIFFGAALVLFLVVGYFAAKRFGLIPGRAEPSPSIAPVSPSLDGRFRVGIDDRLKGRELVGRESGPAAVGAPALKGARANHKRRKTVVPQPK